MNLEDYISEERLKIYESILKLKKEETIEAYNWNKALSSAMHPLMHCLEVTLRNSIDYSIRHTPPPGAAPAGAPALYRTDKNWIFDLFRYLGDKQFIRQNKRYKFDSNGKIQYLANGFPAYKTTTWEEKTIRKVSKRITDAGKQVTAERVISGLDFGFWTNLLTSSYEDPRTRTLLWPNLLTEVFPGAPAGTKRHVLENKFNQIRELRNRLSHHEAIWKFQYEDPRTGKPDYNNPVFGLNASLILLSKNYDNMLELLKWLSPDRYESFLDNGHDSRFRILCTKEGLYSFVRPTKILDSLDIGQNRQLLNLLKNLKKNKAYRLMDRKKLVAIIGQDYLRR
ncbi:Abi family protein [Escherichia coli]|uniref:Abi family protein n=1 Tax=Escherichia coli TaxID=562 RepID=UPI000BE1CD43|nr:Abi family protein [Escherichia coli]CAD5742559.1 Abi-like protein [Escherichia coli]